MGQPLILEMVTQMGGSFVPSIPFREGLSESSFVDESREERVFVTMRVGKVDAVSRNNQRRYPREAAQHIVEAINAGGIEGLLGHPTDVEREGRYHLPIAHWVGAMMTDEGDVYAKAYIVPEGAGADYRKHVRRVKAMNGNIATSVYGRGSVNDDNTVQNFKLERIDFVPPVRAGIEDMVVPPVITSESVNRIDSETREPRRDAVESNLSNMEGKMEEAQQTPPQSQPKVTRVKELENEIAAMNDARDELGKIAEAIGAEKGSNVVAAVLSMQRRMDRLNTELGLLSDMYLENRLEEEVPEALLRPVLKRSVQEKMKLNTRDDIDNALAEVFADANVVSLLAESRKRVMGEPQKTIAQPVSHQNAVPIAELNSNTAHYEDFDPLGGL